MDQMKRYLLFFVFNIFILINAGAEGQTEKVPLDPTVRSGKLENGLSYYIRKNESPSDRAILRLAVNAGSLMEDDDQLGMAHFLEHMAFNGTDKFAKNELVRFLQSIGMQFGPDINAHTSFEETVYKLMIPLDQEGNLDKGLDILEQWAFHMSLTTADIEEERGIIHEEWRSGLGASRRMMNAAYPDIMYDSLYGERLPIGTEDSIMNTTPEAIRRFYKDWYRPELMAVVAVGDFDPETVEKLIIERFSSYRNPPRSRERKKIDVPLHRETIYTSQSDPETTWTAAVIFNKFENENVKYREDYRDELMEDLYLSMFNNRLTDIQNSEEPPFSYAYIDFSNLTRDKRFHNMTVVTPEGELYRGYKSLLTEAKRILDHGFTPGELERARRELYAYMFSLYNNRNRQESVELAESYVNHYLDGRPAPGMDYLWEVFNDYIETISLEDIQKKAEFWLRESGRVVYTMAPESDETDPVDPIRLSGLNYRVGETETEAPIEEEQIEALMPEPPEEGEILSRRRLEEADAQEWLLGNGARVVLKHTDFRENEVLFSAMAPGGLSLADDEDYVSASFASETVKQGGAGAFSKLELDRALAGTTVSLAPYINDLSSGIRGESSREDLEALMQLNYLYFTEPRQDKGVWNSYIRRYAAQLENRDANPLTRYSDMLTATLYQDHPRSRPVTSEILNRIDPDRAFSFYKERFSGADGYTFFITGSYDEEETEILVKRYLASLPAGQKSENWKDRGMRYASGRIEKSIESGRDPLSYVSLIYPGTWEWSPLETQVIQGVSDALQMVVTEEIREKAAGTYSPSVSINAARIPFEDYFYMISFSCDPERTEELIELVDSIIQGIKDRGTEKRIIRDVIKARGVYLEEQQERNGFWRARLERRYLLDLSDDQVIARNDLEGYFTAEIFQDRVRRYFNDENRLELILYPEEQLEE